MLIVWKILHFDRFRSISLFGAHAHISPMGLQHSGWNSTSHWSSSHFFNLGLNFSHRIDHLSFGLPTPGLIQPLNGDLKLINSSKKLVVWFSSKKQNFHDFLRFSIISIFSWSCANRSTNKLCKRRNLSVCSDRKSMFTIETKYFSDLNEQEKFKYSLWFSNRHESSIIRAVATVFREFLFVTILVHWK